MHETVIRILADGTVVPVVLVGAWALLFRLRERNRFVSYGRVLMAGLSAYTFAKLIGSIYQPAFQRPFELLGTKAGASFLDNPGFPSDHVLFCTAITLAVWFETKHKAATFILAGLTMAVGLGRILALVHTPLDVLGGLLIAMLGAGWYLLREPDGHEGGGSGVNVKKLVK